MIISIPITISIKLEFIEKISQDIFDALQDINIDLGIAGAAPIEEENIEFSTLDDNLVISCTPTMAAVIEEALKDYDCDRNQTVDGILFVLPIVDRFA